MESDHAGTLCSCVNLRLAGGRFRAEDDAIELDGELVERVRLVEETVDAAIEQLLRVVGGGGRLYVVDDLGQLLTVFMMELREALK